jgi:hypothetical protein
LHHPAAIEGIRERSTHECHDHERDELDEAEHGDRESGARQLVGLVRQGDIRDLGAEERERLAGEEKAEVPVPPQRADVDRGEANQSPEEAGLREGRSRREPLGLFWGLERWLAVDPRRLRAD